MSNTAAPILHSLPPIALDQRITLAASSGDSLGQAFVTATLLTGNESLAEAAVLKAMEAHDYGGTGGEPLLCRTVRTSLSMSGETRPWTLTEMEHARQSLPQEVRAVLSLPQLQRQCFVLNLLLSLPRGECARLLQLSEAQVASYTSAAASAITMGKQRESKH